MDNLLISTVSETNSYIECISDSFSGHDSYEKLNLINFDRGNYYTNNINITYPQCFCYWGLIYFGILPFENHNKYFSIVLKDSKQTPSLAMDVFNQSTSYSEYFHIQNAISKSDKEAIIHLFSGSHVFNHFYFIDCSGWILKSEKEATRNVTFLNSYINQDLNTDLANTISNCFTELTLIQDQNVYSKIRK